jgi:hypothetical protein
MATKKPRRVTFAAYKRGEGTKAQRQEFERELGKVFSEMVEALGDAQAIMENIAIAAGVKLNPDDDLQSLPARLPEGAPVGPAFEVARRLSESRKRERDSAKKRSVASSEAAKRLRGPCTLEEAAAIAKELGYLRDPEVLKKSVAFAISKQYGLKTKTANARIDAARNANLLP